MLMLVKNDLKTLHFMLGIEKSIYKREKHKKIMMTLTFLLFKQIEE